MPAPIEVPPERSGEVFLLDILSHRMSVIRIFRQLAIPYDQRAAAPSSVQTGTGAEG